MNIQKPFSIVWLAAVFAVLLLSTTAYATPTYVTGTWNDGKANILDEDFNLIYSFSLDGSKPNGMAWDGSYIYSGHFYGGNMVYAYDTNGVLQFSWSANGSSLQGMTYANGYIIISNAGYLSGPM